LNGELKRESCGVDLHSDNSRTKLGILKCIFSHPVQLRVKKTAVFFRSFLGFSQLDGELSNTENS